MSTVDAVSLVGAVGVFLVSELSLVCIRVHTISNSLPVYTVTEPGQDSTLVAPLAKVERYLTATHCTQLERYSCLVSHTES